MRKNHKRADYVPSGPVTRAIQEWLREHDMGRGMNAADRGNYYSPFRILGERVGLSEDAVWRKSKNDQHYHWMHFDVADRLLCATNRFNLWWDDPELSGFYESGAKGADKIYPLAHTMRAA